MKKEIIAFFKPDKSKILLTLFFPLFFFTIGISIIVILAGLYLGKNLEEIDTFLTMYFSCFRIVPSSMSYTDIIMYVERTLLIKSLTLILLAYIFISIFSYPLICSIVAVYRLLKREETKAPRKLTTFVLIIIGLTVLNPIYLLGVWNEATEQYKLIEPYSPPPKVQREWVEFGKQFDTVGYHKILDNNLAYIGKKGGKEYLVFKGETFGPFDHVTHFDYVGEDLAFLVAQGGNRILIHEGRWWAGLLLDGPVNVGGKLAFGYKEEGEAFVMYDGQRIGEGYDDVDQITEIGGKLAYVASKDDKDFVVFDGVVMPSQYNSVYHLVDINGEPAFRVKEKMHREYIVYRGEELGPFYDVLSISERDGKIAYRVVKMDWSRVIVYDDQEYGEQYDSLYGPVDIGGKLAYSASLNGILVEREFIVYDNEKIGLQYDNADHPREINGKIAYSAVKDGKEFIVYGKEEIGKEYYKATGLMLIGDKLAFMAWESDDKKFFVIEK